MWDDRGLTVGVNFLNSPTQLATVERGAAIRKGPFTPISTMCAITEMHWMVLPNPISSARIPFTPFSYNTCTRERDKKSHLGTIYCGMVELQTGRLSSKVSCDHSHIWQNSFIPETQQYNTEHFCSTQAFIRLEKNCTESATYSFWIILFCHNSLVQ